VAWLAACGKANSPADAGQTEAEAQAKRAACTFKAGALPADALAGDARIGEAMPIDHIVLVMQENRSFDHYYSKLSHGGVNVAPDGVTNPDSNGQPVARFHTTHYCVADVHHSWESAHAQYDDGKMDGFVTTNDPDGERAMGYFDETDLPFYYALARTFAMSDAHFCSLLGPTQPNRQFYWAATSFGATDNNLAPTLDPATGKPVRNIFTELNAAHVSWKSYTSDVASPAVFVGLLSTNEDNFRPIAEFLSDSASGNLPQVSVVEGTFMGGPADDESDEHPSSNPQEGQVFVASVVNAVLSSPAWPRTVLFITYDEHGGFYDHVPPPSACEPDSSLPQNHPDQKFDRYGFRTPLFVVSPFARRGFVSHVTVDHTSITRFVEARFGLPAMTARDANAWPLLDLFDFDHPDMSIPTLPTPLIDAAREAECKHLEMGTDGGVDAGTPDAGSLDAGSSDAGELDAGDLDAGTGDAGDLDAGVVDSGVPDAGDAG
jgi:phospholipase C